jgi:uncharacterized protein (DUF983 family)
MEVTRGQIITRGLTNRCPNCGGDHLFKAGTWFDINSACPDCGLKIEKDEGFFLGSMSLNYGVTLIGFLTPVALLWYADVLPAKWAIGLAAGGALFVPVLFYRASRSWWLMNYYLVLPQHLPANRRELDGIEDENI